MPNPRPRIRRHLCSRSRTPRPGHAKRRVRARLELFSEMLDLLEEHDPELGLLRFLIGREGKQGRDAEFEYHKDQSRSYGRDSTTHKASFMNANENLSVFRANSSSRESGNLIAVFDASLRCQ